MEQIHTTQSKKQFRYYQVGPVDEKISKEKHINSGIGGFDGELEGSYSKYVRCEYAFMIRIYRINES